jgi:polysaccharide export outer membrane protein
MRCNQWAGTIGLPKILGLVFGLFMVSLAGCVPYKQTLYLQQKDAAGNLSYASSTYALRAPNYYLQPGDVLGVYISAASPDVKFNAFFSDPLTLAGTSVANMDPIQRGYVINDSGQVALPLLGRVALVGLTVDEARDKIKAIADDYIENPEARVSLLNFYVTLLGEFARPGRYTIYNQHFNLLEALALGGDLTNTANRSHLRLARTEKGAITNYFIDLTDEKLFASPLFYLRPGDVLYVEPLKAKSRQLNSTTTLGLASVLVSVVFFVTNTIILIQNR